MCRVLSFLVDSKPFPGLELPQMQRARLVMILLGAMQALFGSRVAAQWVPAGVPVAAAPYGEGRPQAASDGTGGAIAIWQDGRTGIDSDLYAARIHADGRLDTTWPPAGSPICIAPGNQNAVRMVPDGQGGVFAAWGDLRNLGISGRDIYVQHIDGGGAIAPGWDVGGQPACTAPRTQSGASLVPDGTGGVFVVWTDSRDEPLLGDDAEDVYAQHILPDGTIDPLWAPNGIPIAAEPYVETATNAVPDGTGGFVVAWADARPGAEFAWDIYAQRIQGDGTPAPGWPAGGLLVCNASGYQSAYAMAADEEGGWVVVWWDGRARADDFDDNFDVYAHRILPDGTLDPRWPENGLAVCTAPEVQVLHFTEAVKSDGTGGVFLVWEDYRNNLPGLRHGDVYVQRLTSAGEIAAGWPVDGLAATSAPGFETRPSVASDGSGGAFLVYESDYPGFDVFSQHVLAGGTIAPGWDPIYGLPVADFAGAKQEPVVVASGPGAAIAVWDDNRNNCIGCGNPDVFAQMLPADFATPVAVSLLEARAEEGRVTILWGGPELGRNATRVTRREEYGPWQETSSPEALDRDRVRFEEVNPGPGRFAYRLHYLEGTEEQTSEEVWVEVTRRLEFALAGFAPNPASGVPFVSLSLAETGSARLEVFELRGRLVARRDLSSLGPGHHRVTLDGGAKLAPGVYWLRLTQGLHMAQVRGVVLD